MNVLISIRSSYNILIPIILNSIISSSPSFLLLLLLFSSSLSFFHHHYFYFFSPIFMSFVWLFFLIIDPHLCSIFNFDWITVYSFFLIISTVHLLLSISFFLIWFYFLSFTSFPFPFLFFLLFSLLHFFSFYFFSFISFPFLSFMSFFAFSWTELFLIYRSFSYWISTIEKFFVHSPIIKIFL